MKMSLREFASELKMLIDGDEQLREVMERLEGPTPLETYVAREQPELLAAKQYAIKVMKGQSGLDHKKYDAAPYDGWETLELLKKTWQEIQDKYLR